MSQRFQAEGRAQLLHACLQEPELPNLQDDKNNARKMQESKLSHRVDGFVFATGVRDLNQGGPPDPQHWKWIKSWSRSHSVRRKCQVETHHVLRRGSTPSIWADMLDGLFKGYTSQVNVKRLKFLIFPCSEGTLKPFRHSPTFTICSGQPIL